MRSIIGKCCTSLANEIMRLNSSVFWCKIGWESHPHLLALVHLCRCYWARSSTSPFCLFWWSKLDLFADHTNCGIQHVKKKRKCLLYFCRYRDHWIKVEERRRILEGCLYEYKYGSEVNSFKGIVSHLYWYLVLIHYLTENMMSSFDQHPPLFITQLLQVMTQL